MASPLNDDGIHFFSKKNPVTINLYYDPNHGFIAEASVNGEVITECTSEDDPADALEDIAGTLMLLTDKPKLFNDRLQKISREAVTGSAANKPKAEKQVVQLRPKPKG